MSGEPFRPDISLLRDFLIPTWALQQKRKCKPTFNMKRICTSLAQLSPSLTFTPDSLLLFESISSESDSPSFTSTVCPGSLPDSWRQRVSTVWSMKSNIKESSSISAVKLLGSSGVWCCWLLIFHQHCTAEYTDSLQSVRERMTLVLEPHPSHWILKL